MTRRAAYLDRGIGQTRGVVTLDGLPERLLIERDDDPVSQKLGARSVARVASLDKVRGLIFLTMADGPHAVMPLRADRPVTEGSSRVVRVVAEARPGKGAVVEAEDPAEGPPRLLEAAPDLLSRLAAWAGGPVIEADDARQIADEAEEAALQVVHPLPQGGSIAIEETRALTAIDVDVGRRGGQDPIRVQRQANLEAIRTGARLLRLKSIGGLVVFDLAGKRHNGPMLSEAAAEAFSADGPGVAIGPISRFGLFELALPHRAAPVAQRLSDAGGPVSVRTAALGLIRAIEREARAAPGGRIVAACPAVVAADAGALLPLLADRIGARFRVEPVEGRPLDWREVQCL